MAMSNASSNVLGLEALTAIRRNGFRPLIKVLKHRKTSKFVSSKIVDVGSSLESARHDNTHFGSRMVSYGFDIDSLLKGTSCNSSIKDNSSLLSRSFLVKFIFISAQFNGISNMSSSSLVLPSILFLIALKNICPLGVPSVPRNINRISFSLSINLLRAYMPS